MSSNASQDVQKPRSALASPTLAGQSPRPGAKAVSITEPESISPMIPGRAKDVDSDSEQQLNLDRPSIARRHRTSLRRIKSRPSVEYLPKARTPADLLKILPQQFHIGGHQPKRAEDAPSSSTAPPAASPSSAPGLGDKVAAGMSKHHGERHLTYHDLMKWIQKEKAHRSASKTLKRAAKKQHKQPSQIKEEDTHPSPARNADGAHVSDSTTAPAVVDEETAEGETSGRRGSEATSEGSTALEMLQDMLEKSMHLFTYSYAASNRSTHSLRRPSPIKKLTGHSYAAASDPEWFDEEPSVPSCDAVLDNSKTLGLAGGASESFNDSRPDLHRTVSTRERDAWKDFKYEIVRLAHTLKIRGWRRVSMDRTERISVERLSGALTNAVYMVTPPREFLGDQSSEETPYAGKSKPQKLLLRIYGAQVEHLIDRESELAILRRLARKRIGPRLLGTFTNGRFEEYFNARPLTSAELRVSDISRQIAKRMRELHDGIELLQPEIAAGPFVWQNIDKWMARCERIVTWLEEAIARGDHQVATLAKRGHVVGADFKLFKEALKRYRKWLEENYNGETGMRNRLIFAHNDAQYGNILRMLQEGESPLHSQADEHKKLIVIDFEYANANVPGLEFANHFTEWCYNYNDPDNSHACEVSKYPTQSEQTNFFNAYVTHRPSFPPARGTPTHRLSTTSLSSLSSSSPSTNPSAPAIGMVSSFMLEARGPPSVTSTSGSFSGASVLRDLAGDEDFHNEAVRREVERLRWETRAWRGINSGQWVMWGIVQAKIPGLPDFSDISSPYLAGKETPKAPDESTVGKPAADEPDGSSEGVKTGDQDATPSQSHPEDSAVVMDSAGDSADDDEDEGFDYLGYAFDRARFFWGDVLSLGIMEEHEVPEEVRDMASVLDY